MNKLIDNEHFNIFFFNPFQNGFELDMRFNFDLDLKYKFLSVKIVFIFFMAEIYCGWE